MRHLASWLETSLESEAARGAASVERLLAAFRAEWTDPPRRERLPEYADHLQEMLDRLGSEQRQIEAIADELRLREHWAMIRRVRAMPQEEWRALSAEVRVRYGGYRRS